MKRIIFKPCSLINILWKRKIAFICAEIEIEFSNSPRQRRSNLSGTLLSIHIYPIYNLRMDPQMIKVKPIKNTRRLQGLRPLDTERQDGQTDSTDSPEPPFQMFRVTQFEPLLKPIKTFLWQSSGRANNEPTRRWASNTPAASECCTPQM